MYISEHGSSHKSFSMYTPTKLHLQDLAVLPCVQACPKAIKIIQLRPMWHPTWNICCYWKWHHCFKWFPISCAVCCNPYLHPDHPMSMCAFPSSYQPQPMAGSVGKAKQCNGLKTQERFNAHCGRAQCGVAIFSSTLVFIITCHSTLIWSQMSWQNEWIY